MSDDNVVPLRRSHTTEPVSQAASHREAVMQILRRNERHGLTWAEAGAELGLHHGPASGLLSHLHGQDRIVRLKYEVRNGQSVYVLPEYVGERKVVARRRAATLTSEMAAVLRKLQKECVHIRRHEPPHPTCNWCQVKHLLDRYDRQTKSNGG